MNSKTIFISYSWKTKDIANRIFQDLALVGLKVIKDNFEIKEFESIPSFMERLKQSNYTLIILSAEYLKSRNCMFEVLKMFEVNSELKNVLPILTSDLKIFSIQDRIEYIRYWESETKKLEDALSSISPINSKEVIEELKVYKDISYRVGEFLSKISAKKLTNNEELIKLNYIQILEEIGAEGSVDHLVELLAIYKSSNLITRLKRLENYERKYGVNSFFYGTRALTYNGLKKYEKALRDYELSIELEPENYESLNNLGFLLDITFNKTKEAKEYYIKAIKANEFLSIARLNLGIVYSKEKNTVEAKNQYEKILEYEPTNEKAHSNLGNIYRNGEYFDVEKAEFHLKKAIELNPNFVNGLMNYANFLKAQKKQVEEGNLYYQKARKLLKNKGEIKLIDTLLTIDKV